MNGPGLSVRRSWRLALMVLLLGGGCTRRHFRLQADRDTYDILSERMFDPRWDLPSRSVIPDEQSRLRDFTDPDAGPLPPDDPAAHQYLHAPYKLPGYQGWHDCGDLTSVDFGRWQENLPRDEQGRVGLSRERARELSLLHSRDYQQRVEQLYLEALSLSLNRFEFDLQWFARQRTDYDHAGNSSLPGESNLLTLNQNLGARQNLAGGGQILVDFANSFVWEFTGRDASFASSGLLFQLTQPLLRGAFRQVRLESLTQAERDVLYAVRDFARFRRIFYVDVDSQYLVLLGQLQGIRNQRFNLQALERNLREHEELSRTGLIAPIRVDQVFQNYQQARGSLQSAEQGLETALDNYKFRLGLPTTLEVQLDDSLLQRFELNDPRLDALRDRNDALRLQMVKVDSAPEAAVVALQLDEALAIQEQLGELLIITESDYQRWRTELPPVDSGPPSERADLQESSERQAERDLAERLAGPLAEVRADYDRELVRIRALREQSAVQEAQATWEAFRSLVGREQRDRITDVFVVQTQTRVYQIDLPELRLEPPRAVELARGNRLDLMNQRAFVVDSFRRVQVAADALQADLNVRASANLRTDPDKNNPLRFDASANRYNLGLEIDSPLVRQAERNAYRAAQLAYQQSRRDWMEAEDRVAGDIRRELRDLNLNRFQFGVARAQLIAAARQVEEAQLNLRTLDANDSSLTQDLLGALNNLLNAKNQLISGWVSYEISRMVLFRDLDWLQLDAEGRWTNESDQFDRAEPEGNGEVVPARDADRRPGEQPNGSSDGDDSGPAQPPGEVESPFGESPAPEPAEELPPLP